MEKTDVLNPIEEMFGGKKPEKTTEKLIEVEVKPKSAEKKIDPEAEKKPEIKVEVKEPEAKKDLKEEGKKDEIVVGEEYNDPLEARKPKESPKKENKDTKDLTEKELKRDQEFEDYKKKAVLFDSLANTTIGKILLKAQDSGKDPLEVLREISPTDYSKMSDATFDEQRALAYFSEVDGLKGEELKESIEEFMSMNEGITKRKMRREQVEELHNKQQHKLKEYQGSLESANGKTNDIITKMSSDVDAFIKDVKKKGGKLFGMQLTDDQLTEFDQDLRNYTFFLDEDGYVDVPTIAASKFFIKHGRQRLKENYLKALSKGREEVLDQVAQVDRNESKITNKAFEKKDENMADIIESQFGAKPKN